MKKSSIKSLITDRNFLIIVMTTIGMLPALISSGGYYIRGDITSQMLPFVYETKRMFASGFPLWSWNTYFGDNFIASYAYYTVFNPFTWINCLFPYRYLGLGFTIVLYLKFLLCGYVSQRYLKKIGFDEKMSLIGCLLYTFSSWAITNLYYYMFMEPMILFPFLLIFVERLLRKDKYAYTGLVLATFVVTTVNYYFAPINLIAGAIYFFCRLSFVCKDSRSRLLVTVRAAGCVGLGILCASFVIIPVLMQLKGSSYQTYNIDFLDVYGIADRIFWLLYPKVKEGSSYYLYLGSGCKSHAASIAVFGLLPAVLLFAKNGYGWIKWLTCILTFIYVTPLNGVFSLFTEYDYTRWAFILSFTIIICTLYYVRDFGLPRMKYAVWYCAVVYGLFFLYSAGSAYRQWIYDIEIPLDGVFKLVMDAVLVGINAVALLVLCRAGNDRSRYGSILTAITICVSTQFWMFTYLGAKEFYPKSYLMSENDYFRYGEDFRSNDDFHYRTNFKPLSDSGWLGNNFGLVTNRPSIETFHSIQNIKIQEWSAIVSDSAIRIFRPLDHIRSFEALMSVKDLALPTNVRKDSCVAGTLKDRNGHFSVYESDHYIPMGFAYDHYVTSEDVEVMAASDDIIDIPKIALSALIIDKGDEKELSPYLKRGIINENARLDSLVMSRRAVTCDCFTGHVRGFDAHISLDSAAVVFFSVVADDGFTAFIDGAPTKIYETNLGFSSVIVPAGSHDISFRYFPPGLIPGLIVSALGLLIAVIMYFIRPKKLWNFKST